jgi:hypothetical protein
MSPSLRFLWDDVFDSRRHGNRGGPNKHSRVYILCWIIIWDDGPSVLAGIVDNYRVWPVVGGAEAFSVVPFLHVESV